MNAPDRSAEVRAIVEAHFDLLNHGKDANGTIVNEQEYEDGRLHLTARICVELNREDQGKWGLLRKTDQGNKVPADVIAWLDTNEHFDVLAGAPDRATWLAFGPFTNPAWQWIPSTLIVPIEPIPFPVPPGTPPPAPEPSIDPELAELFAAIIEGFKPIVDTLEEISSRLKSIDERGVRFRIL